jgi:colanic acid/amylovoran biosynthesis glycosyltransferase
MGALERIRPKVAYVVSRFPAVSETFVLRELNAVDQLGELDLSLHSLFPSREETVHPAAERWVERLDRPSALAAARDLSWWLVRRPLRLAASTARVIRHYGRRPGRLVRALATIPIAASQARRLRARGVDHLHAHFATYPALSAWLTHRLTGIPYSFTAHAHDLFADQSMLERKLADAAFAVTISDYNRDFLGGFQGEPPTPLHVIHCGVDPEAFRLTKRRPPEKRRAQALCVATLEEKKGHRILFEALSSSDPIVANLDAVLIGDGPLRAELERSAQALGLSDRVRFLGAQVEDEVRRRLEAADLFVLPSVVTKSGQMEGIPVALMEALASGVPAVASRMSGIPELIRDGVTGYLAEPGDPQSLESALRRVLSDPGLDPAAGRQLVVEEFNISSEARELATLFERSAAEQGAPRR